VVVLSLAGDIANVLLGTVGNFWMTSETGLGAGEALAGVDAAKSSDTGLDLWVGKVCADNELSLLCAKSDGGDTIEPSGIFSEER
jgi:hypothetical protein